MNRDQLMAELNTLASRSAELRSAESNTDELVEVTARIQAVRSEIAVLDAREAAVVVEPTAPEAPKSFGRSAAEKISGAPVGTTAHIERAIIADPYGEVSGAADVTFPQVAGLVVNPDVPVRFLDTLAVASATSDAITFVKETGFTNAAAARLAGADADESDITFNKVSLPVANVAHFLTVAEETLADAPALGSLIDRRGVGGVRSKINSSLLGAADDTNGVKSVVAAATELEYSGTIIDAILAAKSDLEDLGFNPTTVVMTPTQFEAIATSRTDGETGSYLAGGPFGASTRTIWGLNIVIDSALAAGVDALVYDASGAELYVRQDAAVASDRDIVNNLVKVRVQTRCQVAVTQPEAFIALVAAEV